jgi:chromosome segregation ATPase
LRQKKIKVTAHPPAHQTETGYAIIKSMHEIVQKGEIAEAALTEAKEAIATLIAQQDALQTEINDIKTENNTFKTENEQLSNEKRASEVEAAESMRSHNQLVAEYDTAQITIRDLAARIAAITSERASIAQELTKSTTRRGQLMTENASLKQEINTIATEKDSHFKEQITALESEKNILKAKNGSLEEEVEKLEKVVKDTVGGFEAYRKRVSALGNEMP